MYNIRYAVTPMTLNNVTACCNYLHSSSGLIPVDVCIFLMNSLNWFFTGGTWRFKTADSEVYPLTRSSATFIFQPPYPSVVLSSHFFGFYSDVFHAPPHQNSVLIPCIALTTGLAYLSLQNFTTEIVDAFRNKDTECVHWYIWYLFLNYFF
jgi:hypothetical protein